MRRTEVIIVAQWLERLKRAIKEPAVKRVTFPQHHNGAYVPWRQHDVPKIPDLHLHCTRARAGEELPARLRSHSNYTGRPQHAGSRAQPAVTNKHACCDANGYGCTQGRQYVEELGVVWQSRVTEGPVLSNNKTETHLIAVIKVCTERTTQPLKAAVWCNQGQCQ